MIQITKLFDNWGIDYYTEGFKQCRPDWVNIRCPFCNGIPFLGIHLQTGAVNCYQCGTHSQTKVISRILNISWREAEELRKSYSGFDSIIYDKTNREIPDKVDLPYGSTYPGKKCKLYLRKRGLNPQETIENWGLKGTSRLGDYRGRIVAPILKNNVVVSYQCRDITDKQIPKYKACPKEQEIIHHKHYLYGLWKVPGKTIIVVEGIADVWKLGFGSVATFGVEWKREQALLLLNFEQIYIWFDPERGAQKQANKLANFLCVMGKSVSILNYEKSDPGDMNLREAEKIMKKLLKERK